MSTAYVLVPLGSEQPTLATPIEGRWYAGFTTGSGAGAIAQFVDGQFMDDSGEPVDMTDYETLVEQHR